MRGEPRRGAAQPSEAVQPHARTHARTHALTHALTQAYRGAAQASGAVLDSACRLPALYGTRALDGKSHWMAQAACPGWHTFVPS
jgi:hypothetical protein